MDKGRLYMDEWTRSNYLLRFFTAHAPQDSAGRLIKTDEILLDLDDFGMRRSFLPILTCLIIP